MAWRVLTSAEVDSFVRDGYVPVRGAFSGSLALRCAEEIWAATGCDPSDPSTWTEPVVRLPGLASAPFVAAANTSVLHGAFDQLVGAGAWLPRRTLGTIPVRFPHEADPGDDGWHVEASFVGPQGDMRVDLGSRGRALLMLFLFSEVGEDDAPTRIRVGSHLDVPPLLEAYGLEGRDWMDACQAAVQATKSHEVRLATGQPGDVYLCHPFLVHAAQRHQGTRPRLMAQPPLEHPRPFDLTAPAPVVAAIRGSLAGPKSHVGSPVRGSVADEWA